MSSEISGRIPDYFLKEMNTWNLWTEKPQIEFENFSDRIEEFDKQLQISADLLLKLNKIIESSGSILAQLSGEGTRDAYVETLNTLKANKKDLEERICHLKKEDKSSFSLLNWIKIKNNVLQEDLVILMTFSP